MCMLCGHVLCVGSFGVVLLELITGKPPTFVNPNSEDNNVVALWQWVRDAHVFLSSHI